MFLYYHQPQNRSKADLTPFLTPFQFSGEAQLDKYKNQRTTNAKQQEIRSGDSDTEDYHFLWYLLPMYIIALSGSYLYTQP